RVEYQRSSLLLARLHLHDRRSAPGSAYCLFRGCRVVPEPHRTTPSGGSRSCRVTGVLCRAARAQMCRSVRGAPALRVTFCAYVRCALRKHRSADMGGSGQAERGCQTERESSLRCDRVVRIASAVTVGRGWEKLSW